MRSLFALSLALATVTGCASTLKLTGVSSVTADPKDDGIVYVVKDGKALRCTKANNGMQLDNCKEIDIRQG